MLSAPTAVSNHCSALISFQSTPRPASSSRLSLFPQSPHSQPQSDPLPSSQPILRTSKPNHLIFTTHLQAFLPPSLLTFVPPTLPSLFPPFNSSKCPAFSASSFSVLPVSWLLALCLIFCWDARDAFFGLMTRFPRWGPVGLGNLYVSALWEGEGEGGKRTFWVHWWVCGV